MSLTMHTIDELHERLVTLGDEWAEANAASDLLDETRKILISQLGADSGETSATAKESYALRHPDYQAHIKSMTEARKTANKAKVRWETAKIYTELLRTQNANERALMRTAT